MRGVGGQAFVYPEPSHAKNSVIVSISLVLTGLIGAGQALVVLFIVGESQHTDAFFAAYALYLPVALWAASLRGSVVPLLSPLTPAEGLRIRAGAVVSRLSGLGLVLALLIAGIAPIVGPALTHGMSDSAQHTAVWTLLLLAPAGCFHFHSAGVAAALSAARRFHFSAVTYTAASALSLASSALMLELFGILGAPAGLLVGTFFLALAHTLFARRLGLDLRPTVRWLFHPDEWHLVRRLFAGAAMLVSLQLNLALSLALLSGDPGAVTAYTFAFFIVSLMLSVTFAPLGLVTKPQLVERAATTGLAAVRDQILTVTRYAFAILAPLVVGFIAYGRPLLEDTLGPFLSNDTLDQLFNIGVVFAVMAVPAGLFIMMGSILEAVQRWSTALTAGVIACVLNAAAVVPVSSLGPVAVALGQASALTLTTVCIFVLVFHRETAHLLIRTFRRAGSALALASVFVGTRLVIGQAPSSVEIAVGLLSASAVYGGLVYVVWPDIARGFASLLPRRGPSVGRTSDASPG